MNKTFSHISLALILSAAAAPAALVTVTDFQTNGTDTLAHPYAVSTTDLLNGIAPTAQPGNFVQEGAGGAGVAQWNNWIGISATGTHPGPRNYRSPNVAPLRGGR